MHLTGKFNRKIVLNQSEKLVRLMTMLHYGIYKISNEECSVKELRHAAQIVLKRNWK
jgi:hypothetical protein